MDCPAGIKVQMADDLDGGFISFYTGIAGRDRTLLYGGVLRSFVCSCLEGLYRLSSVIDLSRWDTEH